MLWIYSILFNSTFKSGLGTGFYDPNNYKKERGGGREGKRERERERNQYEKPNESEPGWLHRQAVTGSFGK